MTSCYMMMGKKKEGKRMTILLEKNRHSGRKEGLPEGRKANVPHRIRTQTVRTDSHYTTVYATIVATRCYIPKKHKALNTFLE